MAVPDDLLADEDSIGWQFDNTYSRLPAEFFAPAEPALVRAPRVAIFNKPLAEQLGLNFDTVPANVLAALLSGQELPRGSQPIAQAYAGHQYGGFTMLGDGRAILLGEHRAPSGQLFDVQLKGSGRTQFSRGGDGLAALGPMLREYIISEAMHALEIPTTRSLAVVATGEKVYRATSLPGAILTRVATSHIRVGTFQYLAARRNIDNLRALADYTIDRHYPQLAHEPDKYLQLLRAALDRQASLIARWQLVGFIHGVMNTDNMAISGETIDYGPCAFMNAYSPDTVFSSIDRNGRYAYGNQPSIAHWNLTRFAETLLPLVDADQELAVAKATEVLAEFPTLFEHYWLTGMRAKLGLQNAEPDDLELIQSLLAWMEKSRADFTNTFRDLSSDELPADERCQDAEFQAWHARWQLRLAREDRPIAAIQAAMRSVNPAVIPRNHRVEEALAAAEKLEDYTVLQRLVKVLQQPFEAGADAAPYREAPLDDSSYRTFCGT